jgi:ABC-2 type transport system ATP-binding protein
MIELRGLSKHYGDTVAVDGLTCTVEPGRVTGFLGPNGAGKTTTMRMVLGLDHPTSGTATVDGRRYVDLPAPMQVVGALLDAGAVHSSRKAHDHLLCLAQSSGIARRRIDDVLGLVGLDTVAHRRLGTFSLGMSQRLGIAAALLGDPPVLIFDEPVNGLDPEGILWIRTLMRDLAYEGRTVLVSSHLMSEMAQTADHLIVIGRGRLIADASVDHLMRSGGNETVFVRASAGDALAQRLTAAGAVVQQGTDGALVVAGLSSGEIGALAAALGAVLSELIPQHSSLEAAYLQLTRDSVEYAAT